MLRTILVDDNQLSLEILQDISVLSQHVAILGAFQSPLDALHFARNNTVDFAFLDIDMPGLNGLELGRELRKLYPKIILIYVASEPGYCAEAMRMKADFYICKPYVCRDIAEAIERARLLSHRLCQRLTVRTFGHFDVFDREQPLYFSNAKSKELLAMCIDRCGSAVSMEEAIEALWPERPIDEKTKRLYRKAVIMLKQVLAQHNSSDIFHSVRGSCNINPGVLDCDYYDHLNSPSLSINAQDYMLDYTWAEETAAKIYFEQS